VENQNDKVAERYANVAGCCIQERRHGLLLPLRSLSWTDFRGNQIEKKRQLIADFIEEHGNLLTFLRKKFGAPGSKGRSRHTGVYFDLCFEYL
jgi:hypothetical protein